MDMKTKRASVLQHLPLIIMRIELFFDEFADVV